MVLVATQVKRRRGTTAENDAFTGAEGEITVDTEKHELRVHDGLTQGGFKVGSGTGALIIGQILEVVGTADYTPVGCLLADGSEYTKAQFSDLWANFLTGTPKLQTCTYTEYANQIAEYGFCNKFAVDTTNETFKVPTRNKYRKLVKKIVNGTTWANLYDDGWVEQGGITKSIANNSNVNVPLPITMSDTNYTVTIAQLAETSYFYTNQGGLPYNGKYTTYIVLTNRRFSGEASRTIDIMWKVSGYAPIPDSTSNITREFVVVANGTLNQEQMDWSAWASSLAGKANIDLSNTPANVDYVVESQEPTEENSWTWYRKYKSGWVEQGGRTSTNGVISATNKRITLPIVMANSHYYVEVAENANSGNSTLTVGWESTTAFSLGSVTGTSTGIVCWQVKGMSAQ